MQQAQSTGAPARVRRPGGPARLGLSLVLFLGAAALLPQLAGDGAAVGPELSWWHLALAGIAVRLLDFHVQIGSERYPFAFTDSVFVLGLLFVPPDRFVLGLLLAELVVLVGRDRHRWQIVVLSLLMTAAQTCLGVALFRLPVDVGHGLTPTVWASALAAGAVGSLFSALVVWMIIRTHGVPAALPPLLGVALVMALCNGALAVVAALLLVNQPVALVLLIVVGAALFVAYRGYSRTLRRFGELETLHRMTRMSAVRQSPEETLVRVLDEACELLKAERAAAVLLSPGEGRPTVLTRGDAFDGLTGLLADRPSGVVVVPRTSREPADRALLARLGVRDCMVVPVAEVAGTSGFVLVADRVGGLSSFDADDAGLFTALVSHTAMALENGRLIERLHDEVSARAHEATHDPLTGLPNRAMFADRAAAALAGGGCTAVMLLDLDRFKEVNDDFGHHVGDLLLVEVARRLRAALERGGTPAGDGAEAFGDLAARLGGDEFAILLPDLPDPAVAQRRAERIHHALCGPARLGPVPGQVPVEIAASLGLAVSPDQGTDLDTLLRSADLAMYGSKRARAGEVRNRSRQVR